MENGSNPVADARLRGASKVEAWRLRWQNAEEELALSKVEYESASDFASADERMKKAQDELSLARSTYERSAKIYDAAVEEFDNKMSAASAVLENTPAIVAALEGSLGAHGELGCAIGWSSSISATKRLSRRLKRTSSARSRVSRSERQSKITISG